MKTIRLILLALCSSVLFAQASLTTISDVLYAPFNNELLNATCVITPVGVGSTSSTTFGQATKAITITRGVLNIQLPPNDTAIPGGSYYSVRCQAQGQGSWTETWAVPTTLSVLHVRDVRNTQPLTQATLLTAKGQLLTRSASYYSIFGPGADNTVIAYDASQTSGMRARPGIFNDVANTFAFASTFSANTTFGAFTHDFSSAAALILRSGANLAPTAAGSFGYDTVGGYLKYGDGSARTVPALEKANTFSAAQTFSANTIFGAATHDFSASNAFLVRSAAGLAPTAAASLGYDQTTGHLKHGNGSATRTLSTLEDAETVTGAKTFSAASAFNGNTTFGAATHDFSGASALILRKANNVNPTAAGSIGYDTATNTLEFGNGSATRTASTLEDAQTISGAKTFNGGALSTTGWLDSSTAARPTCNVTNRGLRYIEKGTGASSSDQALVCVQTGASTYAWQTGTWQAVGTGAVPRDPQDKMRDVVSVKDYGAVGDGATDDTAAIQNAINTVSSSTIIEFPAASFVFTNLAMKSGVILRGKGQNQTTLRPSSIVSPVTHIGPGAGTMIESGIYTGTSTLVYCVQLQLTGTPDTFEWDTAGCTTFAGGAGIAITGGAQTLTNGIRVIFGTTTGHTAGDQWTFTATPNLGYNIDMTGVQYAGFRDMSISPNGMQKPSGATFYLTQQVSGTANYSGNTITWIGGSNFTNDGVKFNHAWQVGNLIKITGSACASANCTIASISADGTQITTVENQASPLAGVAYSYPAVAGCQNNTFDNLSVSSGYLGFLLDTCGTTQLRRVLFSDYNATWPFDYVWVRGNSTSTTLDHLTANTQGGFTHAGINVTGALVDTFNGKHWELTGIAGPSTPLVNIAAGQWFEITESYLEAGTLGDALLISGGKGGIFENFHFLGLRGAEITGGTAWSFVGGNTVVTQQEAFKLTGTSDIHIADASISDPSAASSGTYDAVSVASSTNVSVTQSTIGRQIKNLSAPHSCITLAAGVTTFSSDVNCTTASGLNQVTDSSNSNTNRIIVNGVVQDNATFHQRIYIDNTQTSYDATSISPAIYSSLSTGGAYPFTQNSALVYQSRPNGTADHVFVVGASTIGTPTFTGAGLNDLTKSGGYTFPNALTYCLQIDGTGTPDTFKWGTDATCTTFTGGTSVAMTGAAQLLSNGVSVTFAATTGHTLSDQWTIVMTPSKVGLVVAGAGKVGVNGVTVPGQALDVNGSIALRGATSGIPVIAPQAVAGSPTLTLPNASGTFAVSATTPLSLSATTGALTLGTVTLANGGLGITSATSGGIPYFSSTSAVASSAALTANVLVKGGGAGAAPSNSSMTDNGTTVSSSEAISFGSTLAVTGTSTLTGNVTHTGLTIFGDTFTTFDVTDATPVMYGTSSTGLGFPFNTVGSLVLQSRANSTQSIVLVTGTSSVGTAAFTGSGLNDLTKGGSYNGAITQTYCVQIDGTGTPDTFKWGTDATCTTFTGGTAVAITGAAQTLANGVTVTFAATIGHTLADHWTIVVTTPNLAIVAAGSGKVGIGGVTAPAQALDVKGSINLLGSTSGNVVISPQAVAGTPTLTLPNASGTFAVSASGPLSLSATTGALTCATCATTTNGGALSATTPIAISAAGVISLGTVTLANGGLGITTATSGGIPYFASTSTVASSAALTANVLVKGGGAGAAPAGSSITDNGTTVSTTESVDVTSNALVSELANAGTTGTTLNKVAKLTGAPSTAVIAGTSDTSGIIGIVIGGAGTTGNAQIARDGQASCVFDGATTANDYVQASTSVGGDCHDAGAAYPPTGQTLGRVLSTNASGGTYAMSVSGTTMPTSIPNASLANSTIALAVPSGGVLGVTGTPAALGGTLTLTATGNSGGLPYFSSASAIASSATLASNVLVKGGGSGAAPSGSSITDNGTTVSTAEAVSLSSTLTVTGTTTHNGITILGNSMNTFDVIDANPVIYGTLSTGNGFPFNLNAGLVLQSRTNSTTPITFVTGTSSIATPTFTGTGLNDLTKGGSYNGAIAQTYCVQIDATGTPDTFKWGTDATCTTFTGGTAVAITGAAQTLANGVTVTFAATTGHTLADHWTIAVTTPKMPIIALGSGNVQVRGNGTETNFALDVQTAGTAGGLRSPSYFTATNCSSSASPAVCSAASAGSVVIAAAASTVVVNTTAVTANSQIFVMFDESLGTKLSVTCNSAAASEAATYFVSARSSGTSFTIKTSVAPTTNPACLSYHILN